MENFFFPVLKTAKDFRHNFPTYSRNKAFKKKTTKQKKTHPGNTTPKFFYFEVQAEQTSREALCLDLPFLINTLNLLTRELESLQNSRTVVALGLQQLNLLHPVLGVSFGAHVHPSPSGYSVLGCADTAALGPWAGSLQWFRFRNPSPSGGCSVTACEAVPGAVVLAQDEPSWGTPRGLGRTGACFPGFSWEQEERCFVMPSPQGRSHWLPFLQEGGLQALSWWML